MTSVASLTPPSRFENKQYEMWEENTYVMCEVLGWRGIWLSEERRRMGNVDLGRTIYLGLPYYGRWLLAVARILVEKHHIGLSELAERMAEVKARYADGLQGKPLEAKPKFEGDPSGVKRNRHHTHAVGKGDPQVYAGQAGRAEVSSRRPRSWCGTFPSCSIPAPRSTCGARGAKSRTSRTKARQPRTRPGTGLTKKPEWFYIVRFNLSELWHGYTGPRNDTLQTEIPERWLEAAG